MRSRVFAVVPTCRGFEIPAQSIPVEWVIVCDGERYPIKGENFLALLTPPSETFGRRCDCIRSAGFLAAYKKGADFILTTDDDCTIPHDWAESHVDELQKTHSEWHWVAPNVRTRGTPRQTVRLPVAVTHGLWNGIPDLDAEDQKDHGPAFRWYGDNVWRRIDPPFAQSAMNLGFRREVMPVMYMPMQGPDWPFDRFSDIWCGVMAQRLLTLHGYSFSSGGASVEHLRASSLEVNLVKEAPGKICHEEFWQYVWKYRKHHIDLATDYGYLAKYVGGFLAPKREWDHYFVALQDNMLKWLRLLES